jgi:hypothetical protein
MPRPAPGRPPAASPSFLATPAFAPISAARVRPTSKSSSHWNPPAQLISGDGDTIDVLGLTLDGPAIRTIDPTSRAFFVGVGGSIQIAADQADGDYNALFDVTAHYQ